MKTTRRTIARKQLILDKFIQMCTRTSSLFFPTTQGDQVGVKGFVSAPLAVAGIELANVFHQIKVGACTIRLFMRAVDII